MSRDMEEFLSLVRWSEAFSLWLGPKMAPLLLPFEKQGDSKPISEEIFHAEQLLVGIHHRRFILGLASPCHLSRMELS